jgi:hypothetical protein
MGIGRFMGRRLALAAAGALAASALGFGAGCSAAEPDAGSAEDDYTRRGRIQLYVSVDWEGRELAETNLAAMERLHERFPQIKIVHFLNAAYFTKPGADAEAVTAKIARTIAPGDEHGLHIHGWKRLFESAGVEFRTNPTFWGESRLTSDCSYDCGHEVPISAYSSDELRKVVKFSNDTLEANGFARPESFRTGGWMGTEDVRAALAAEGIRYDSSAVPTEFLEPQLGRYPVHTWLSELWSGTTPTSQPYTLPTTEGDLLEIPDNGALADYMTADQMVDVFQQCKAEWKRNRRKKVVVSIGFHQETAARYLPELERALTRIYEIAEEERIPVESVTSAQITARR